MAIAFLKKNYEILPVISTAVAISQLSGKISLSIAKAFGGSCESFGQFSQTFSKIEQKSILSICIMAIPIIGNIAIYLLKKQNQPISLEPQHPAAQPAHRPGLPEQPEAGPEEAQDETGDAEHVVPGEPQAGAGAANPQAEEAIDGGNEGEAQDEAADDAGHEVPGEPQAGTGEQTGTTDAGHVVEGGAVGETGEPPEERLIPVGRERPCPLGMIDRESFLLLGTNSQAIEKKVISLYRRNIVPTSNLLGNFIVESYGRNKKIIHSIVVLKGAQIAWTPFVNAAFFMIKYFPAFLTFATLATIYAVPALDGMHQYQIALQHSDSEAFLRHKFTMMMKNTLFNGLAAVLPISYTLANIDNFTLVDGGLATLTYLLMLSIIRQKLKPTHIVSMGRQALECGILIRQKATVAKTLLDERILFIHQKAIVAKACFNENILPKARSILAYPKNQYDPTSTKTKQIALGMFVLFTLGVIAYYLQSLTTKKTTYPMPFLPHLNFTDPAILSLTA